MECVINDCCLICSTKIPCDKYIISGKIGIQYICLPENVKKLCIYVKYGNDGIVCYFVKFVCHDCVDFVKRMVNSTKCKKIINCNFEDHLCNSKPIHKL